MRLMHLSKEREEQSGITNRQGINSVNLPTWYMPSYAYQDSSNREVYVKASRLSFEKDIGKFETLMKQLWEEEEA